jgi:peptide/nickel transport system substrate-binding protein
LIQEPRVARRRPPETRMENRFGIKDLFLFLLIGAVLVVVALAMWQFDRQYDRVQEVKQQNSDLATDLKTVKDRLNETLEALDDLKRRPSVSIQAGPGTTGQSIAASQQTTTQPAGSGTLVVNRSDIDAFTRIREAEKMPGFARGDWLVDNFSTKLGRLTPLISSDIYQRWVESQVMEGMAVRDPMTLDYVPCVARSWEVSSDGLTMTFFLRRGVEFSDGKPLTADDIVFTFDLVRNPAINADRDRSYLTKLKSVTKIDDRTVRFEFSEFYYLNFSVVAAASILPKHFYSRFTPDQINERTGLMLGSGPYRLEDPENWSPGQQVKLVRNERYWGTPGTFDRIIFNEIEEEGTESVLYGNKEHDLIRCTPEQYRRMSKDQRIMAFSNSHEFNSVYKGYSYIGWNQVQIAGSEKWPSRFADKRVRQAMTMLIDRERIVQEIYYGYATVATGPFSPTGKQANPDIKPWPFDEARAKALLAEAGYTDRNGDKVIEGPDGKPFRFTLTYSSGNETTEKIVLFIKDSFARGGIVMDLDRVDWPVLIRKLNASNFDAVILGFSSSPESDPYQVFHSSQIAGQGDNRIYYSNPELDKLIDQARTTVDETERMKLWNKVHSVLHEDQPNTFLMNRKELYLTNKRLRNITPGKIGLNFDYLNGGMMPWFVTKGEQKYTQ